ncbi:thylakoid membrane photosystem I accumulation factor [filamentous cyanobacterium LEGE 11480]|uniref:Thylakoid membrane photosystem I accumulation factor n=1 Tax=Romeriopsis navalis LEGE 11480 TaxID=2777977 RepID=A0A928VTR8_9CYAN|nr:thylakoid membrane photosystem I accumulation factor [Romeriopsis navalis]MBE9032392.1 thylakoid membrane photosystem I accumulation factor [Romeriopsis navalis LEGE 11480]
MTLVCISCLVLATTIQPAWAGLTDDNFDGEIFALYAGNGSIVPPKNDLAATLKQNKAAVLVFYVDDSRDCKEFSIKISNLQGLYSRVANFIPVRIDSIPVKESYDPLDAGYYYKGYVPQTVIFNPQGEVKFDESGQASFESLDDTMREIFSLLPRTESSDLKRRPVNEISGELAN